MLYSKSTGGFYSREIHGNSIPADAVEISEDRYQELLTGQSAGKLIAPGAGGFPILAAQPEPSAAELAEAVRVERDRRLTARDWTQLADVPGATRALWAPYRQALRDVPGQPGFPYSVAWPAEPGA